jgi:hypothetical protein
MNQKFSAARDILLMFFLCVLIVFSVSVDKNKRHFLPFNGMFQSSRPESASTSALEKQRSSKSSKSKKKELFFLREFKWKDPTEKERKTLFSIPNSLLKSEARRFGRARSMTNPLLMKRWGFKIIGKRSYIHNRRVLEKLFTIVDYQQIFLRNVNYFSPFTTTLITSAELPPGKDPLHTFLSFVQSIKYQQPPNYYKGKFIGAFFVPLVCLYERYGDCDSKSMLLAEFLATFPDSKEKMGMVLVRGGGLSHALLGVKRKPFPGMTALYFQEKGYFIVLETTRPGWAPGFIDRRVTDALKAGYFMFVDLN